MTENNNTTELVEVDDSMVEPMHQVTVPTTGALQRLEAEVAALDRAYHWAKAMSKTTMVPEQYQMAYKPRGCTDPLGETATYNLAAAVMYGIEIGLSAMQAAQNVFVIHGKPAVYARTMAAQVRAAGYQIEEVEASDEKVVWKGLRDDVWSYSEWTIERATAAGYTANAKYQSNPQEMLRAKCIAEVCRIKYQDVLLGMAYSVEELQLENVTVTRPVRQGVRGTAKLRELADAQEEDDAPPPDARVTVTDPDTNITRIVPGQRGTTVVDPDCLVEEPQPSKATAAQLTRLRSLFKARGVGPDTILGEAATFLQREEPLESLMDLLADDALALIEHLKQKPEEN